MQTTGRRTQALVCIAALAVVATVGIGAERRHQARDDSRSAAVSSAPAAPPVAAARGSLDAAIAAAQVELKRVPGDWNTWGQLGLAYVQQAKNTVDPAYYPKAQGALTRSLALNDTQNYVGMTGMAALAAGRHDFTAALAWTDRSLKVNAYSSETYGVRSDALLQLGRYDEAFAAIQREADLQPGASASARASYAWELRGDIPRARATMQQALDTQDPADQAFAEYYLGELDFSQGDPASALAHYAAGLQRDPSYAALLEGRAKARWATGDTPGALSDFADLVQRVPEPTYVREYGELLDSIGQPQQAQQQYRLLESESALFTSNGVALDLEPALYYADHGDPVKALAIAQQGVVQRPFLEVQDALAWALHKNGRDTEALAASTRAMVLGTRNALFFYHRGIIEASLGQSANARTDLTTALTINPYFSPLHVPLARAALAGLPAA